MALRILSGLLILFAWWFDGVALGDDQAVVRRTAWTTSRIVGAPHPPDPYRIVCAFPHIRFEKPTCIEEIPDTNRLLVTENGGKVYSFLKDAEVRRVDLALDLRERLPHDLKDATVALLDAEFHPQFRQNRHIFLCYVNPTPERHTRVSRFTLKLGSAPQIDPASEHVVITWPAGGHNAGCLEFGTDGFLYIATGDGTGPNPPDGLTTGQDVSDLLGAILRIDVDGSAGQQPYRVPEDNPFVGRPGARPEIWAYGLRNPFKFGIDPEQGDIFAADNGWESWESVHRIVRGGNCGWPVMEGRAALRTEVAVGPTPILPPVKDHPHTEANSVIGGPVYRGGKLPDLRGVFVYGDYITGTIWGLRPARDQAYTHTTLVDTDQRIVAFTQGSQGELFVLDYDLTGQVYELLPSDEPDRSAAFPRRLSETGLFRSLETLEPAPGVVPYSVCVPRWMDGAVAQRWIAIPGSATVQLTLEADQNPQFPEGTVVVKNITLPQPNGRPAVRLETQLLHFERGSWRPYSYLWDESGRDAVLVSSIGTSRSLPVPDPQKPAGTVDRTWHVNAANECKLCHEGAAKVVLGFSPHQLNRVSRNDLSVPNQLSMLAAQGVLADRLEISPEDPGRLVDPHDVSESLEDRARSYLHGNCSMCHHPGGNAIVSFYLRRDLPFEKLNTNKGTGIGTFGMRDAKLIVPGDPYRSVLLYRMSKLGYARMPYIGSQLVDSAGVALIEQWIRSLPPGAESRSAPATDGTAEATVLRALTEPRSEISERETVIQMLARTTEGTLALTSGMHAGRLSAEDVRRAIEIGRQAPTSDIRGLFETFLPESQRRKTLGTHVVPAAILGLTGDRERGKLIFFSDHARCRACHHLNDREQSVGPTLLEINKKYARPEELLQHVLQPSQKVDEPFAAYLVTTADGRVITGLLIEKSDREVVVKTAEKQIVRVPQEQVEELRKSPQSLMPERILSDLTAQEAADLFAYLRSPE